MQTPNPRDQELTEFVEASSPALQRTAYLVCADRELARDVVQDALFRLCRAWPKVRRIDNPLAYARRMVVNAAIDASRRPWRREGATERVPDQPLVDDADRHADRDELLLVLRGLPPRQRACLALRYYEDLSVAETAQLLDCSEPTVRSQTSRALATLRQSLGRIRAEEQS